MHYFFASEISKELVSFTEEEGRHMIKSLRIKEGDQIHVLDGKGGKYLCQIKLRSKNQPEGIILSREETMPDRPLLHLAIAPTKNPSRLEWLVEKATEMGISEITLLSTRRTERSRVKDHRLQKIAVSALKQSGNLFLPTINDQVEVTDFIARNHVEDDLFIAHCETTDLPFIGSKVIQGRSNLVLIGPEGDFTLDEVKSARERGFTEISLGKHRLRTETAGIFVTTLIAIINNGQ